MREIKFRFWDSENKMMLLNASKIINGILYPDSKDTIPLQYTGLKDKNGKDIYEGDVVEFTTKGLGIEVIDFRASGEMKWCDTCGGFHIYGYYHDGLSHFKTIEVLGDRYSNPELLQSNQLL